MKPALFALLTLVFTAVSSTPAGAQPTNSVVDQGVSKKRVPSVAHRRVRGLSVMGPVIDFAYFPKKILSESEWRRLIMRRSVYQGFETYVDPSKEFDGVDKETSEAIADYLGRLDFIPLERIKHFAWCTDDETIINGWCGVISEIVPVGEGWKVTIATYPSLYRYGTRILFTHDRVEESYILEKGGTLHFIRAVDRCYEHHGRLFDF